jgi:hypothetical protein
VTQDDLLERFRPQVIAIATGLGNVSRPPRDGHHAASTTAGSGSWTGTARDPAPRERSAPRMANQPTCGWSRGGRICAGPSGLWSGPVDPSTAPGGKHPVQQPLCLVVGGQPGAELAQHRGVKVGAGKFQA